MLCDDFGENTVQVQVCMFTTMNFCINDFALLMRMDFVK